MGRRKRLRTSFSPWFGTFLGNHKAKNSVVLVETLVKDYSIMGCRISLTVHILEDHLDKYENVGAYPEEQGECFHQDLLDMTPSLCLNSCSPAHTKVWQQAVHYEHLDGVVLMVKKVECEMLDIPRPQWSLSCEKCENGG